MEIHLQAIRTILLDVGERVEGNMVCDIHPDSIQTEQNKEKIHNLRYLVTGKQRVCEIGVNAGHSVLLMLDVNDSAAYTLFDIGTHAYTRPCLAYLQKAYPQTTLDVFYGDSKETLPAYTGTFEMIHVDGGHCLPEVRSDYTEAVRLISPGCPIIFDDYDYPVIRTFVDEKLQSGDIVRLHDDNLRPTDRQIVVTVV
jgi:predicted O-methyltransferase YrrM